MPPLTPSQLVSGTVLPPGTTITGPVRGAPQELSPDDPIPLLRFMILAKLPRPTTAYDADQKGTSVQRTEICFAVHDTEWTKSISPKSSDMKKAVKGRVTEALGVLGGLMRERKVQLEVDVGGMRVESRKEEEHRHLEAHLSFEGEVTLKHVDSSQGSDITLLKSGKPKKRVQDGPAEWTTFDPPSSKHAGLSTAKPAPPNPPSKQHMPMSALPIPVRPRAPALASQKPGMWSGGWPATSNEAASRPAAGEAAVATAPKTPVAKPPPKQSTPASRDPPGASRTPDQTAQPPPVKQSPQLSTSASRDAPGASHTITQAAQSPIVQQSPQINTPQINTPQINTPQINTPASRGPPGVSRAPAPLPCTPIVKQSPPIPTPASRDPPGIYRTPTHAAHPIPSAAPADLLVKRGSSSAVEDQAAVKRPRVDEPSRYVPSAAPAPAERQRTGQVVNKPSGQQAPAARAPLVAQGGPADARFDFRSSSGVRYSTVKQFLSCGDDLKEDINARNENVGVIGYVKNDIELRQVYGGDFFVNLPLADETNVVDGNASGEDMMADIFRQSAKSLEGINANTVILIRSLKLKYFKDKQGNSKDRLKITVASGSGRPQSVFATMSDGVTAVPEDAALFKYSPLRDDEIARMRKVWAFANPPQKEGEEAAKVMVQLPKRMTIEEASGAMVEYEYSKGSKDEGSKDKELKDEGLKDNKSKGRPHFDGTVKILKINEIRNSEYEREMYVTDGTIAVDVTHVPSWDDWGLPKKAILIVWVETGNMPTEEEGLGYLKEGNIVKLPNLNMKRHGETQALETIWVRGFTLEQLKEGWKVKKATLIQPGQPAAKEIEERIDKLRREKSDETGQKYMSESEDGPAGDVNEESTEVEGEKPVEPMIAPPTSIAEAVPQVARELPIEAQPARAVERQQAEKAAAEPSEAARPAARPSSPREIATHLRTEYSSGSGLPASTLKDIILHGTGPKAFRTVARVLRVFAPDKASLGRHHLDDTLLVPFCKKDETEFGAKSTSCLTCGDVQGKNAEWRYRFFVLLEDDDGTKLVVCVRDEEAERFLPALPPYTTSTGPNEDARRKARLATATAEARDLFMGEEVDGVRPRPWIEFTLDAVLLKHQANGRHYLLHEMWGMRRG